MKHTLDMSHPPLTPVNKIQIPSLVNNYPHNASTVHWNKVRVVYAIWFGAGQRLKKINLFQDLASVLSTFGNRPVEMKLFWSWIILRLFVSYVVKSTEKVCLSVFRDTTVFYHPLQLCSLAPLKILENRQKTAQRLQHVIPCWDRFPKSSDALDSHGFHIISRVSHKGIKIFTTHLFSVTIFSQNFHKEKTERHVEFFGFPA